MIEQWKDIKGYEGKYQVSNTGKVRSLERHYMLRASKICIGGKELKPYKYHGYLGVRLSKNSKAPIKKIHRLVLEAFVGDSGGLHSRHLDGNRENNNLDNLKWGTRKENEADKVRHGTNNLGERHGNSKLCDLDVWLIRNIDAKHKLLAEFFGISRANVSVIKAGKTWTHVT